MKTAERLERERGYMESRLKYLKGLKNKNWLQENEYEGLLIEIEGVKKNENSRGNG